MLFAAVVCATVLILAPLMWLAHWLLCRLVALRCPRCGSKWRTECQGEWDCWEQWECHRCGYWWQVNNRRSV